MKAPLLDWDHTDIVGVSLAVIISALLGLFMTSYKPLARPISSGECIKYREARQSGLFMSSVECVEWQP